VTAVHCIRDARAEDAPAIADAWIKSWQIAYAGQLPDDLLAAQESRRSERVEQTEQAIRNASGRRCVLVAEDDGRVAGFVSVGPSRDEGATAGEVYAIYLQPTAWGRGFGRDLLSAASGFLRDAGFGDATLWVLGSNLRARRFYEAAGWQTDGATRTEVMRGTTVDEVRYRKTLSAAR